jgi:multiple antibiotic resistance protein
MTEFARLVVVFLAAVNPASVALVMARVRAEQDRPRWPVVIGIAAAAALALYALAAGFAHPLLDFLDVAPESFRLAAGVVLAVVGASTVCCGALPHGSYDRGTQTAFIAIAVGMMAGPAGLTAAVSSSADHGLVRTLAASAVALTVTGCLLAARPARGRPALDAVARVTGALLIAIAAGLATSGVRAI